MFEALINHKPDSHNSREKELTPEVEAALGQKARNLVASVDMKVFRAGQNQDKLEALVKGYLEDRYRGGSMNEQGQRYDGDKLIPEVEITLNPTKEGGYNLGFREGGDYQGGYRTIRPAEIAS